MSKTANRKSNKSRPKEIFNKITAIGYLEIFKKWNTKIGRIGSKMKLGEIKERIKWLNEKLKGNLKYQDRKRYHEEYNILKEIKEKSSDLYGKSKVDTSAFKNVTVLDQQMIKTLEKLRNPHDNERVKEFSFGIGEQKREGKKVKRIVLLQGKYGESHNFDYDDAKKILVEGHTHPPYEYSSFENWFQEKNGVIPKLEFKYDERNKKKKELDQKLYNLLNNAPSSGDIVWLNSWDKPNIVYGGEDIAIAYPGQKSIHISDTGKIILANKVRVAFAKAILNSDVSKAKTLPDYERKIDDTRKNYQKNIRNLYSKYNVHVDFKSKDFSHTGIKY